MNRPKRIFFISLGKFQNIAVLIVHCYLLTFIARQGISDFLFWKSYSSQYGIEQQIEFLERAIKINPGNPLYHDKIGLLYSNMGNHTNEKPQSITKKNYSKLAIDSFRNSVSRDPINPNTQLHLASANYKVSKNKFEFRESIKMIEKLDPHNKIIAKYKKRVVDFIK